MGNGHGELSSTIQSLSCNIYIITISDAMSNTNTVIVNIILR